MGHRHQTASSYDCDNCLGPIEGEPIWALYITASWGEGSSYDYCSVECLFEELKDMDPTYNYRLELEDEQLKAWFELMTKHIPLRETE